MTTMAPTTRLAPARTRATAQNRNRADTRGFGGEALVSHRARQEANSSEYKRPLSQIPSTEAWTRTSAGIGRRSSQRIWIGRSPECET